MKPVTCSDSSTGHLNPNTYSEYGQLKDDYGPALARKMIKFRLRHAEELYLVAKEYDLIDTSQIRILDANDVYYDAERWQKAKGQLTTFQQEMPEEGSHFTAYEGAYMTHVSIILIQDDVAKHVT